MNCLPGVLLRKKKKKKTNTHPEHKRMCALEKKKNVFEGAYITFSSP